MNIKTLNVSDHPDFDQHEEVVVCSDDNSGLHALIAIHNTHRGPALGGCRMWPYPNVEAAVTDVLRLSRGMTYKSALADLPLGGGKAVIIGDPRWQKTPELMQAMGDFIHTLEGRYITAEDSGTSTGDMQMIKLRTPYASGLANAKGEGGDPSPSTAYGVFIGMQAAYRFRTGKTSLKGAKVAIAGVGSVGFGLAKLLCEAGAKVTVADVFDEPIVRVKAALDVDVVPVEQIHQLPVDIYSPCALGGAINSQTVEELQVGIVAGAANNQLASDACGDRLQQRDILYVPDYAVNAGGIIDICYQYRGGSEVEKQAHIERTAETLTLIFQRAKDTGLPPCQVADTLAEQRFGRIVDTSQGEELAAASVG